jgi:hypothetical protein
MPRKTIMLVAVATALAVGGGPRGAGAADAPGSAMPTPAAAAKTNRKLDAGLPAIQRLLQLMDTDANGKISKDEFMRFMEAEFDKADVNHDNELDPKELGRLVQALTHPVRGPGR